MVIIYDLQRYELRSYGHGLSYLLVRKPDGATLFWQGDDALQFRDELEAWEAQAPEMLACSYFDSLFVDYAENVSYPQPAVKGLEHAQM